MRGPKELDAAWRGRRVLLTGSTGFVGRNLVPLLQRTGADLILPTREQYDLTIQDDVRRLLDDTKPEYVFNVAGLVGGLFANKRSPGDYFYQNLLMGSFMMHESQRVGVKKYVTLIGACSYPSDAPNPIAETSLWNGYPESSAAPYSLAKRMNIVQAQAYRRQYDFNAIVLAPGNIYGPHDNFDLDNGHVIPALIRRFWEARTNHAEEVVAWGTGRPVRDFIYIEDACEAILIGATVYDEPDIINLSSGVPTTIAELTETISDVVGFKGRIRWDTTKLDGQMFKGLDVTRMHEQLGYECRTPLRQGIEKTVRWFEENYASARLKAAI